MTLILSQIIGLAAVATFLWSYQQKKRKNIILWNAISRCLYIVQYLLLGAFSGAVLDVLGALSSALAGRRDRGWMQKHTKLTMLLINGAIIAAGLVIAVLHRSFLGSFTHCGGAAAYRRLLDYRRADHPPHLPCRLAFLVCL